MVIPPGVINILNVWLGDWLSPPLAVPPSSEIETVTVAFPNLVASGVKVSVPEELMAGWELNNVVLSFETLKDTV